MLICLMTLLQIQNNNAELNESHRAVFLLVCLVDSNREFQKSYRENTLVLGSEVLYLRIIS